MSRLMSVALTEQAVREQRKTVTRRLGWRHAHPGMRLTLCGKVMGRRAGEPLVRICDVQVVGVRREPLEAISADDVAAEGFPDLSPAEFVTFFCQQMRCQPSTMITRIEWRYLNPPLPDLDDFEDCAGVRVTVVGDEGDWLVALGHHPADRLRAAFDGCVRMLGWANATDYVEADPGVDPVESAQARWAVLADDCGERGCPGPSECALCRDISGTDWWLRWDDSVTEATPGAFPVTVLAR